MAEACPLCGTGPASHYYSDRTRSYYQCRSCGLVFLDPAQRLALVEEKAQYDLHCNSPTDQGYRQFLSRAADPVARFKPPPANGLDFGSGPGPTLSVMLQEQGYTVSNYDPVYAPDHGQLACTYDFITCTEVIEHVYQPSAVWQQLFSLLAADGLLVIMTKRVRDQNAFASWHYRHDPTHVCFYSEATFQWLAAQYSLKLTVHGDDVVSFSR